MDLESTESLSFHTEYCLPDVFVGPRPKILYQVFQENDVPWNYTILTSFLNELEYFTNNPQNACILARSKLEDNEIIEFRFVHKSRKNYKVQVKIFIDVQFKS